MDDGQKVNIINGEVICLMCDGRIKEVNIVN